VNHTSDTATAENGGPFDPRQAAELLDQATQDARRKLTSGTPLLYLYRAVFVLVAFGGFWLSARHQHPYTGPDGWSLLVAFTGVAINIVWSALLLKRAGAGVTGPTERARRTWIGIMVAAWIVAYGVTAPLYHAGAGHPVWGLYPASAPLMIVGIAGAVTAPMLRDRTIVGVCLALAVVGALAGFGGPAGSWLIMGIGLCVAMLAAAAFITWRLRRSVVRP
jgi:hypothetical protein